MSCPIIFNSNTIELTVHTFCYCLELTLCYCNVCSSSLFKTLKHICFDFLLLKKLSKYNLVQNKTLLHSTVNCSNTGFVCNGKTEAKTIVFSWHFYLEDVLWVYNSSFVLFNWNKHSLGQNIWRNVQNISMWWKKHSGSTRLFFDVWEM